MAFNNIPPNGFPALPDVEDLEAVEKDVTTLKSSVLGLTQDVTDLTAQKANQITIAPFFNSETAYDIGDLVYYNGLTYRCTNAHEGEWDADNFVGTTIANELDTLKSGLTDLAEIVGAVASMMDLDPQITYNYNLLVKIGNVIILAVSLNNVNHGAKIGTVPSGYRPSASTGYLPLGHSKDTNAVYRYSTVLVYPDGGVYAYNDASDAMQTFMGIFMWTV